MRNEKKIIFMNHTIKNLRLMKKGISIKIQLKINTTTLPIELFLISFIIERYLKNDHSCFGYCIDYWNYCILQFSFNRQ